MQSTTIAASISWLPDTVASSSVQLQPIQERPQHQQRNQWPQLQSHNNCAVLSRCSYCMRMRILCCQGCCGFNWTRMWYYSLDCESARAASVYSISAILLWLELRNEKCIPEVAHACLVNWWMSAWNSSEWEPDAGHIPEWAHAAPPWEQIGHVQSRVGSLHVWVRGWEIQAPLLSPTALMWLNNDSVCQIWHAGPVFGPPNGGPLIYSWHRSKHKGENLGSRVILASRTVCVPDTWHHNQASSITACKCGSHTCRELQVNGHLPPNAYRMYSD